MVTAETLTDEDIRGELDAATNDFTQAKSMIEECKTALWPRRRTPEGLAHIAAAINARAKAGAK